MGFRTLEKWLAEKERKEQLEKRKEEIKAKTAPRAVGRKQAKEIAEKANKLRKAREKKEAEEAKQQAEEEKKRLEELSRKSTAHSWLSGNIVTTRQGLDALGELEGFQIDWEKWDSIVNKTREKNGLPPLDVEAEMAKEEEEEVTPQKRYIRKECYLSNAERDAIVEDIYNGKI